MIPWFPKLLQMIAMIDYPKWLPSSPECAKNFCLLKCILFFLLLAFIQELSDLKAHQRRETMIKGIAPSPINNPTRKFKTKLQIVLSGYKIRNPIHSPDHVHSVYKCFFSLYVWNLSFQMVKLSASIVSGLLNSEAVDNFPDDTPR